MKIKVFDTIYDSEVQPVMVILNDKDKENIGNMSSNATKYCGYPSGSDRNKIFAWMQSELSYREIKMDEKKLWDFMEEFVTVFTEQLKSDDKRWGNTWLERTRAGQEERTEKSFNDYFDQYENAGVPVPWMKIIGNAYICWVRENHPELFEE